MLLYRMEVLRPGKLVVTSDKNDAILVDNSFPQNPSYGHVVLDNFVYKKDTTFITDSLSTFLMRSIADDLLQEGFFKNVRINPKARIKSEDSEKDKFLRADPLSTEQIRALVTSNDVDLIISLDHLTVMSKTNVHPFDYIFRATRDVSISSIWRIYDASNDRLVDQFQYRDSLYWQTFGSLPANALQYLPVPEETFPEIAEVMAKNISRFLGPYWEQVDRFYFCTGSYRMKYASDCIRNEDWKGAAALWLEEYNKGFGRSVYRAAMNMMLYHEVQGDMNEAMEWGRKTEQTIDCSHFGASSFDLELLKNWLETLQMRSIESEKLKIYFNGNLTPNTKE